MSFNSYRAADGFGHSSSSFQIRLRPINAGMRQHKAGQGRAGQGRAGQDKAGQDKAGQGRARQDRTGQGQNMTGQDRAGQTKTGTGQGKTRQDKEPQGRARQSPHSRVSRINSIRICTSPDQERQQPEYSADEGFLRVSIPGNSPSPSAAVQPSKLPCCGRAEQ
ncbi:hypothetical protein D3C85_1148970 [compost metagenome]